MPVLQDSVFVAERDYSNWKVRDLVGEFSKTYNNIEECILSFAGVTKNWKFNYSELCTHFNSVDKGQIVYNQITVQHSPNDELITLLYKVGFFRKIVRHPGNYPKFRTSIEEAYLS